MKYFDPEKFNKLAEERHNEYLNASPFAHIVLFDLFDNNMLQKIHDEFPAMEKHMKGKANKTTLQKLSFRHKFRFRQAEKRKVLCMFFIFFLILFFFLN